MNYETTPHDRDPHLWHLAQRRASFKRHLAAYVILNTAFWVLWYFTHEAGEADGLPWPVWPMLGWGIGVAFHYASAYLSSADDAVEKEYHKLLQTKNKQ